MLFTFKDVHHVVADKFVCKSTTNDTWKKNIPESPFKGILSKRFFFGCNYSLSGLSQCCLLLRAEQ